MAYTPALPNHYDSAEIPVTVRKDYFKEVILSTPLSRFMGHGENAMIQLVNKPNGTGPTETFSFLRDIDYKTVIYDYDQISGKGQNLTFYTDTINVRQQSRVVGEKGKQLVEMNTPIQVFNALKPSLMRAHIQELSFSLLRAATEDLYPDVTASGPSANRVIYSGVPYAAGANNNIQHYVDNMTGTAPTQSGLTVKSIIAARNLAVKGGPVGTYRQERRIFPFNLEYKNATIDPYYVLLTDTDAYTTLSQDPQFNDQFTRGVIESQYQPSIIKGCFFKGMINNVMIYEMPDLADFAIPSTDGTKKAAWNLFCGAQAFGLIHRGAPWFVEEMTNMRTVIEMGMLELRGQKALQIPSYLDQTKLVEHGIIHMFSQII